MKKNKTYDLRRWCAVAVAAALLPTQGCSWIFTEGPPPQHAQLPYFDCSTSYAPPVLDTIWGGLNFLGAVNAIGTDESDYEFSDYDRDTVIAVGVLWVGVSFASAFYGYQEVADCRDAKGALMMRSVRPDQRAPYPQGPYQQPYSAPYPPQGRYPYPVYPPQGQNPQRAYPPQTEPTPPPAAPPSQAAPGPPGGAEAPPPQAHAGGPPPTAVPPADEGTAPAEASPMRGDAPDHP